MMHITKTWVEDGKMITEIIPAENVYKRQEWVGLTAEEREQVQSESYGKVPHHIALIAAVEKLLKEKNSE